MTDLIALAERVEALSGTDQILDAEIAFATGWKQHSDSNWGVTAPHWYKDGKAFGAFAGAVWYDRGAILPPFTASIDAAMTLVPKNHTWMLDTMDGFPEACVAGPGAVSPGAYVKAATPALALCAASLRALAHKEPTR